MERRRRSCPLDEPPGWNVHFAGPIDVRRDNLDMMPELFKCNAGLWYEDGRSPVSPRQPGDDVQNSHATSCIGRGPRPGIGQRSLRKPESTDVVQPLLSVVDMPPLAGVCTRTKVAGHHILTKHRLIGVPSVVDSWSAPKGPPSLSVIRSDAENPVAMNHHGSVGRHRRVLITGGSGFIGTNVVEAFLRDDCIVLNLDVIPPRAAAHIAQWRQIDILDKVALDRAFSSFQPELVIHLAAKTVLDERTNLGSYAANIQGVENVIGAVQVVGSVERTLFTSSRLVCRLGYVPEHDTDYQPSTLYGLSKVHGEQLVRAASSALGTWTILRPTGIWGPWFGVPYRDFFMTIKRGRYVHPAGRDALKSYGYVENTAYQLQQLAARPTPEVHGRTLLIADYPPVSVRAWATLIQEAIQARPIPSIPILLLKGVAAIGDSVERLGLGSAPLTSFRLNNLVSDMVYDTSPLEALVGPLPHTLTEGVERTAAWLESHGRFTLDQ